MAQRVRLRMTREGEGLQLSHLKQINMVRHALAESGWPISMTNEKRAKPRASFGPAIAVGYASECEWVDVELAERMDLAGAASTLNPHLPKGFSVADVKSVPRYFPSLEEMANVISYEVTSPSLKGSAPKWESFWKEKEHIVIKKKKEKEEKIDMRRAVRSWNLDDSTLTLELRVGPNRTLKPERILEEICGPSTEVAVKRTQMSFETSNQDLIDL